MQMKFECMFVLMCEVIIVFCVSSANGCPLLACSFIMPIMLARSNVHFIRKLKSILHLIHAAYRCEFSASFEEGLWCQAGSNRNI